MLRSSKWIVCTLACCSGLLFAPAQSIASQAAPNLAPSGWCRYEAPQFTLLSDLKETDALLLSRDLQRFHRFGLTLLKAEDAQPTKPLVFAFRNRGGFNSLFKQPNFAGYLLPALTRPMMVFTESRGQPGRAAFHEYAHYLLRERVSFLPPLWYDEGLAGWLSTVRFKELEEGRLRARWRWSSLPQPADSLLRSRALASVQDVRDLQPTDVQDFYNRSALAVQRLHRNLQSHPVPSTAATLARQGTQSRRARALNARTQSFEFDDTAVSTERSGCLDLAQYWSYMHAPVVALSPNTLLDKLNDLPNLPQRALYYSLAYEALGEFALSIQYAEDALPERAAQIQIALAQLTGCILTADRACDVSWLDMTGTLRRALEQDPNDFEAIYGLGLAFLYRGQPGDSLNYLRIAHSRAPWSPRTNFFLGEALRLIGDPEAERHLRNAANWSSNRGWKSLAERALELLEGRDASQG